MSRKKRTVENEEALLMKLSQAKDSSILRERKTPQSSNIARRRVQSHMIEPISAVDDQFLSLFAK